MDYNGLFIFATQYIVINNSDLQHASWLSTGGGGGGG